MASLRAPISLMKTHKHLFEQVCSLENILAASREALKNGKRAKPPGARYFADLEKHAVRLRRELLEGTYRHGGYTYFKVHEPKERLVAAAACRDRVLHHAIVRVLEPIFERRFIEDSFACRKGKGTHAALRRCAQFARRFPYALKGDVQRYFPSIDHGVLRSLLCRVVADEPLLAVIDGILASHADGVAQEWSGGDLFAVEQRVRGLPIGNLTSQFFANVFLNELDHFVKHTLRVRGYVRYVDDFILFADNRAQLRAWGAAIRAKLSALRLRIHPDKYRLLPTRLGVDFVGFVSFANGRRRVRTENVRRFARKLRRLRWEARQGRRAWSEVTLRVRAWAAHAAHGQSVGLRRRLFTAR
jgi:retron-type reverse transcriptase